MRGRWRDEPLESVPSDRYSEQYRSVASRGSFSGGGSGACETACEEKTQKSRGAACSGFGTCRLLCRSCGSACIFLAAAFAVIIMMPGSKVRIHDMLACQWVSDFMTRPKMRKKWGRGPMISESWAGLWGAERRWRSSSTDRSGAETRSTEQSVWHLLIPTSLS